MKLPIAAALFALALLPACLENDEEITVRPDGSCSVHLVATGQPQDFADGYPLPTGPEWRVLSADVPEYLALLRLATKPEELRQHLPPNKGGDIRIELAGEFGSVQQLPKYFASGSDPYLSAYLARSTGLKIEPRGAKTLYTFERRFGARDHARFDAWSRMKSRLPQELVHRLDKATEGELPLRADELPRFVHEGALAMRAAELAHFEDALLADYTLGNATLPAKVEQELRSYVDERLAGVITEARLRSILDLLFVPATDRQLARTKAEQEEAGARLSAIENETRDVLRTSAHEALARAKIDAGLSNAILAELESSLTAQDQTEDLGDETFTLRLHLPGTLVGGNYDKLEDGAAVWIFRGDSLQDREIVLRAVSIVE